MSKNSTLKTSISGKNAKATQVTEEFGTLKKDIAANKSEFSDATEEPASISRSMPVRAVKSCFQDIQQLLEEMNSDITASEATELDHKKTFEELSDTKNEEIAANPQQHKEKSLEAQETKLSHDRKNWKGPRSTLMSRRHFLRISTQLEARDHFSKTKQTGIRPTCKAFPSLGRGIDSGVWLERRAELEKSIVELNSTRTTA